MIDVRFARSGVHVLTLILIFAWAADSAFSNADRIIEPGVDRIEINIGEGVLIRLPAVAASVYISDPEIADLHVRSPELFYVTAFSQGEATFFAVDDNDMVLASIDIVVLHEFGKTLRSALPDSTIDVHQIQDGLMLTGQVHSAVDVEEARRIATQFIGDDGVVMNRLQVIGPNQVNLRVKVAEVSRNVLERIGFHFDGILLSGNFQFGLATGRGFLDTPREVIQRLSDTGLAHLVYESSSADINAIIDALVTEGLVSLLAEPNLTALSGETASFLAGGEFPIPVADNLGTISVEFKDYGVSLAFTPTVLTGNRINLKVMPEVSSITSAGAVTVEGISIPALSTRRASTSVELGSGQSFAIAGLLLADTEHNIDKFPGLGDLPILGALFRSTQFKSRETELVVIVTPYIVQPVSYGTLATPNRAYNGPGATDGDASDGRSVPGPDPALIPGGFEVK